LFADAWNGDHHLHFGGEGRCGAYQAVDASMAICSSSVGSHGRFRVKRLESLAHRKASGWFGIQGLSPVA
jgi:hypothetical protein